VKLIDRGIKFFAQKRGFQVIPGKDYTPDFRKIQSAALNVNHDTALKFSAVFSAIRIRSENIASLPKSIVKQTAGKKKILYSHPVYQVIGRKPNSLMNVFTFWEFMNSYTDGWGNSYAIIERNSYGDVIALWPVEANFVFTDKLNNELFYKVTYGDHKGTYHSYEVIHFKLFTIDGIKGVDPITYMNQAIALGLAAETFNAQFYASGGHIKGVYETEQALGDEQYTQVMNHLASYKNFETPLLEYGIKYNTISISPEAAQMIEQRTFTIQDIARIFNLPPHMLAENSHSTFSNIEHQDIQFVKYSIRPSVKRYETEIEDKLLFSGEKDVIDIKFNLDGLLRGDTQTRSQFYHNAILDGWMSRNEVRELENMEKGPDDLDDYLVPTNMTLADLIDNAVNNKTNNSANGNK
jgi:HK97 family phage portal protein